jgi:hypothetical protein
MTVGIIFLGLALLVVVVAFIARPFWMPNSVPAEPAVTRDEALEAEKAVLLDQIRALDFDLETGKIPADVHQAQRARLVAQAAALLQQLDLADDGLEAATVWQPAAPLETAPPAPAGIEAEIEAALERIRQARATQSVVAVATAAATVTAAPPAAAPLAAAASAPTNGTGRFCGQCGQLRESEDKFCAYCGHRF